MGHHGVYVVLTVSIETGGGRATALLLIKITMGRRWLLAAVVLPWCLPPVVYAIIWGWITNPSYGLMNRLSQASGLTNGNHVWFTDRNTGFVLVSVVPAWPILPLTVIILLAALQSIAKERYEGAKLGGAIALHRLRQITLPLIAPVFAIYQFDEAWILNGTSTDTRSIISGSRRPSV